MYERNFRFAAIPNRITAPTHSKKHSNFVYAIYFTAFMSFLMGVLLGALTNGGR